MNKILLLLTALFLMACSPDNSEDASSGKHIVVTTNIIYDAVNYIAGDINRVEALMGPGVDPHLYKASQKDVAALTKADMIVFNGLHLEGKMIEVLEKLKRNKEVLAFSDGIAYENIIKNDDMGTPDPHFWFDAALWAEAVSAWSEALIKWDEENAEHYKAKAAEYIENLRSLHDYSLERFSEIDENRRILVTAHDAFHYMGRAYAINVHALQGISTVAEFGLKDVTNLVDFIIVNDVSHIFIESSVSDKSLRSVLEGCKRKGHEVEIGGMLYSDAMGAEGSPEGTYEGMFRHNVETIMKGME